MNRKDSEKEKQISLPDGRDIDPSALTTQMVWREIQSLKELQSNEIQAVKEGIKVAHEDLVRVPTQLSTAIGGLQTLLDEKIKHVRELSDIKINYEKEIKYILDSVVNKNFDRVEALRLEYKSDSNKATQDALTAQKELNTQSNQNITLIMNKNEALFTKLIDAMGTTMAVGFNNIRETIGDLKNNQSTTQGKGLGRNELIAIILLAIALLAFFSGHIQLVK